MRRPMLSIFVHRLAGLVPGAEDLLFESRLRRDFCWDVKQPTHKQTIFVHWSVHEYALQRMDEEGRGGGGGGGGGR